MRVQGFRVWSLGSRMQGLALNAQAFTGLSFGCGAKILFCVNFRRELNPFIIWI